MRGLAPGSVTITATSNGVSGSGVVTVFAVPVNRITLGPRVDTLLTGHHIGLFATLFDQEGGVILDRRRIDWTSGDPAVATVDTTGRVAGVAPGSSVITATSEGVSATVVVTVLLGPKVLSVDGDWTMTLSPSPSCRDKFPVYAQERTYAVHFTQEGADFRLTINAPTLFVLNPFENGGTFSGSTIVFSFIGDTYYGSWSSWDLYDHLNVLSDREVLNFGGGDTGTVSESEIHASMDGEVNYWSGNTETIVTGPTVVCGAHDHVVTLRR